MERLADLTEGRLLRRLFPLFGQGSAVLVGPGDDAAVLRAASGSVVASTDSMVSGLDWRDDWSGARDVGRKVAVQNVADIAAMGAVPTGLLVSLLADPDVAVEWVLDLARGIAEVAELAGASVVGGDLSAAPPGVVVVSVTALGDLEGRQSVLRSGARPGDEVAVCGSLGLSGAGLALYAGGTPVPDPARHGSPRDEAVAELMAIHRTAGRPPWEAGPEAADAGARAMIDVSDGLVTDLGRVAAASGVSVELSGQVLRSEFAGRGPLAAALSDDEAMAQVLSGGEEHSLVASFPPGSVPRGGTAPWVVIGRATSPGPSGPEVTVDGVVPRVRGWDHFAG